MSRLVERIGARARGSSRQRDQRRHRRESALAPLGNITRAGYEKVVFVTLG
jgi:hypothetical protein